MPFSDFEKARVKHFSGYPDWRMLSNSIQLGFPAGAQPLYLLEQAFQRLTPGGEESVRRDLCECEKIETALSDARTRFKVVELGSLKTNPKEVSLLERELTRWTLMMLSDLGCFPNPYGVMQAFGFSGGGRNATVIG